jgi:hypothetical protein
VLGVVNAQQVFTCRGSRLGDFTTTLPELGRQHLHDLGAFDPLGMPGGSEVIGEPRGRDEVEAH